MLYNESMSSTEAHIRASNKYNQNNYDSITGLSKTGFKVKGDQQSMILNGTIISFTLNFISLNV